jgi:hypothetical protein
MSVPSPTSSRPSSPAPPPIPGHRAPLSSAPRVPSSRYHLAFISPPLISLLNLSSSQPVFNGVKANNVGVNRPGHPTPAPIKGEHPPRASPHLSRSYFPLSPPEQPSHRAPLPPHSKPSSPGLLNAARAPMRPEPSSPRTPLRFAPPPASFGAPERPEAKLR